MNKKIYIALVIAMIVSGIILLSGCTTEKGIYTGRFISVKKCSDCSDKSIGIGIFQTKLDTLTVYITGSWQDIELNKDMKITVHYWGGWNLDDYDYL